MDPRMSEIEYEILALSRHINSAMGRSTRGSERLEESAYTLLNLIDVGGPMSIGALRGILGLDASTLNRQTAALVRSGLVERRSDGGVARKFFLTSRGREMLAADRGASQNALSETLKEWPAAETADLLRVLRAFNAAIERRYRTPWPRL